MQIAGNSLKQCGGAGERGGIATVGQRTTSELAQFGRIVGMAKSFVGDGERLVFGGVMSVMCGRIRYGRIRRGRIRCGRIRS